MAAGIASGLHAAASRYLWLLSHVVDKGIMKRRTIAAAATGDANAGTALVAASFVVARRDIGQHFGPFFSSSVAVEVLWNAGRITVVGVNRRGIASYFGDTGLFRSLDQLLLLLQ